MNFECRQIREKILRCSAASGHGHIPTCFSIVELMLATYRFMRHNPGNPASEDRDLFVLSKGHGALGYYCVLAHLGYFDVALVERFGQANSPFGCHPDRFKVPGVEVSCGSLGHGIGVAVGMALALKMQRSGRRVFVLIGDGESNEGSVWEAIMVASNLRLENLTVLLDYNRSQERCLQICKPAACFDAFGCQTVQVDGHDLDAITAALAQPAETTKVIVANTIKGFGCKTLVEGVFEWHRRSPKPAELQTLVDELYAKAV